MGNNQNNQGNQNNQLPQNPFDPKEMVRGLSDSNVTLPIYGTVYRMTCEQLEQEVEILFQQRLGFKEVDHVLIYPVVDRGGKDVCTMNVVFYFNTTVEGSSITRNGDPNGTGVKTILDFAPSKSVNGEFSTSEKFTKTMSAIAVLDNNGKIPIKSVPDKRIACIEVDFFLLMALCLGIDEDKPYNFTIMTVDAGNNRNNNGYENAVLTILKYIDNSKRYNRSRGSNGRKIDYRAMDKSFIRSGNPGSGERSY